MVKCRHLHTHVDNNNEIKALFSDNSYMLSFIYVFNDDQRRWNECHTTLAWRINWLSPETNGPVLWEK